MDARERFIALMTQEPQAIPLDEAALLVAAEEYPDLDIAAYRGRLDAMSRSLEARVAPELEPRRLVALLNDHLFGHLGFRGNVEEYYDPRNSFLNEVIDRRVGIPITLSILHIAVGTRLGLPLAGVSFPGHFVVAYRASPEPLFLDPFNQGRFLRENDFRLLHLEQFGPESPFAPTLLRPATPQEVVARLLRNLKHIYTAHEDFPRAIRCAERIVLITGLPEERRDLGILLSREGRLREAIPHLERYLVEAPLALDHAHVEAHLAQLRRLLHRLN